ncbi:MAG: adenylate/guanylate cyclase domain-containing protein [Myxococcales bacterium]|nr:adenylate/guanylate cyclase domain-containing protein [Myxococcales bacterium]
MSDAIPDLDSLQQRIIELEQRCQDLETILEITAEHADSIEIELEKRNELLQSIFGRYVTKEVVEQLLSSPEALRFGGERRQLTILCSDLRGFTALAERLPAEDIIRILTYYLGSMAGVIMARGGTVNLFLGDGILVYFGAPVPSHDHARRALGCALAMQAAMPEVNRTLMQWGYPALEMGIGLNTGEAVVGNVGSEQRAQYGAIGAAVNLAFRIESYTTGGGILASAATLSCAGAGVQVADEMTVFPKGSRGPLTIYPICGLDEEPALQLVRDTSRLSELASPLPVRIAELHEKEISLDSLAGWLRQVGPRAAVLGFDLPDHALPALFTNLRLELPGSVEAYAKVKRLMPEQRLFYVSLTQVSPEFERALHKLIHGS